MNSSSRQPISSRAVVRSWMGRRAASRSAPCRCGPPDPADVLEVGAEPLGDDPDPGRRPGRGELDAGDRARDALPGHSALPCPGADEVVDDQPVRPPVDAARERAERRGRDAGDEAEHDVGPAQRQRGRAEREHRPLVGGALERGLPAGHVEPAPAHVDARASLARAEREQREPAPRGVVGEGRGDLDVVAAHAQVLGQPGHVRGRAGALRPVVGRGDQDPPQRAVRRGRGRGIRQVSPHARQDSRRPAPPGSAIETPCPSPSSRAPEG